MECIELVEILGKLIPLWGLVTTKKSDKLGNLYINQQKVSRSLCVRTKRSPKLVISNFHQRQRAKDDYNDAFFPDEIVRSRKETFC